MRRTNVTSNNKSFVSSIGFAAVAMNDEICLPLLRGPLLRRSRVVQIIIGPWLLCFWLEVVQEFMNPRLSRFVLAGIAFSWRGPWVVSVCSRSFVLGGFYHRLFNSTCGTAIGLAALGGFRSRGGAGAARRYGPWGRTFACFGCEASRGLRCGAREAGMFRFCLPPTLPNVEVIVQLFEDPVSLEAVYY